MDASDTIPRTGNLIGTISHICIMVGKADSIHSLLSLENNSGTFDNDTFTVHAGILDNSGVLNYSFYANEDSFEINACDKYRTGDIHYGFTSTGLSFSDRVAGTGWKLNPSPGNSTNVLTMGSNSVATWKPATIGGTYNQQITATSTVTVSIPAQTDNLYKVGVTPGNSTSAANYYISNKTLSSFDVVYLSPVSGTLIFDWIVNP